MTPAPRPCTFDSMTTDPTNADPKRHGSISGPRRTLTLFVVNALSILRLGLAFAFPSIPPSFHLPVVAIAGFSDFADGVIARRFGGSSWIGGIIDAVADKLFVFAVLFVVARDGDLALWQIGLLLARDAAVGVAAAYAIFKRRWDAFQNMASRAWGKRTTAALFVLFLLMLAGPGEAGGFGWVWAERIAFAVAAAFSVLAAFDYWGKFVEARRTFVDRGAPS